MTLVGAEWSASIQLGAPGLWNLAVRAVDDLGGVGAGTVTVRVGPC